MPDRPQTIGITGSIGAGKSTLVDALAGLGAARFSADAVVHELYDDDYVRDTIRGRWGDEVFAADGTPDREAIAGKVFSDPDELRWLEGLLHPMVAQRWLQFVDANSRADDPPPAIVAEVPLLFEAGVQDRYDTVVVVTAPLDERLRRVGERAHGASHAAARDQRQLSEEEKSSRADVVFVNDGDTAAIAECARQLLGDRD
jgi:dephospho-CoA kinase